jgi:glyoxylase-like metal-dependent hydrolase (beta-lactamase superfamily II)
VSEKAAFATFETSGGRVIHRMPLQAFPKFWAYAYLVRDGGNTWLIDCGSGTETSHEDLLKGFHQAGVQPGDLTHILLTHAHIDHYGGLSRLKPLTDAKIGCHELDLQTVAHHDARLALIGRRLASFLADSGLSEETRDQLLSIYRFTKAIYRSVAVDFVYREIKDHVPTLDLIHLPGHCPGHVAIRLDDVIFCGDMVVERVTPHLAPESLNPHGGLDHYLESLFRLQRWAGNVELTLNGHNDAITDLDAHIETTRQNILRRISMVIQSLHKSLTIAEVCAAVYGNSGGYNQLLMIEKTGAYIEYLYQHGMVEIANPAEVEQALPARYRRLREIPDDEILERSEHVLI